MDPALLEDPAYVKSKGILQDIEMFDAAFFSVPPREAAIMDPQHRLFLECAWEALENAACNPENHKGRIGVYSGTGSNAYFINNLLSNPEIMENADPFQLLLCNRSEFVPTRTSYKLNLTGPSVNLGTSCSTSLAAVATASQSLLSYQCDLALAGGVRLDLPQHQGYRYREGGILSPDGRCRPFDRKANGTVSGSGVGVVVLKRLAEALYNRDHIYAVIRGSAMNNDGAAKVGFAAPSVGGQAEVIAEALEMAEVGADTIGYVEAHGTATPMGDPIELAALTRAFRLSTPKKGYCAIGSVKANIGHLDAAAGMASIIKTALILKHGIIPPSIHFDEANPRIDFPRSPFYVQTRPAPWPPEKMPRRAGVSAFGVGGTNVHLVLEAAPPLLPRKTDPSQPGPRVLAVSAKSAAALDRACLDLARFLNKNQDIPLIDVARTLGAGRKSFPFRHARVCETIQEARNALEERQPFASNPRPSGAHDTRAASSEIQNSDEILDMLRRPDVDAAQYHALLTALARHWVQGGTVEWHRLYGRETGRFVPLPTYPFERQAYWIEARQRKDRSRPDLAVKNAESDQWFYLPSWRRTLPLSDPQASVSTRKRAQKTWLFLMEKDGQTGPGDLLAQCMRDRGDRTIMVNTLVFLKNIQKDVYDMAMGQAAGYPALLADLKGRGALPDEIVHLRSLTPVKGESPGYEEILQKGFFSLIHLARALEKCAPAKPVTITLLTNGIAEVAGTEPLMPEKATLLGPARVISQEYPWISCRVVDIVPPALPGAWYGPAKNLEKELLSHDGAPLVALRGRHRWIPHPEKVNLRVERETPVIRENGVYLITGGLGAIGMGCAEFLAREYRARPALISRSQPSRKILQKVAALEQNGAKILIIQADVSDEAQMQRALDQIESRLGPLNGVFHGAGITGKEAFRTMTEVKAEECRAHFRAKVLGTLILERLLTGRNLDFCLLHSSLAAILGGVGFAAYAAANNFLDLFAAERNRHAAFPWISINWDGWQFQPPRGNTTLPEKPDMNLAAFAMQPAEGLEALKKVLRSGATRLAVSTGDLPARMAKSQREPDSPPPAGHARPELEIPYAPPDNEIEAELAAIWQDLFGIEPIGIHDDFFLLDGDSVLAAQAAGRIRDRFGIEMPLPEMFERPTISQQAAFVLEAQLGKLKEGELEALLAEEDYE